MLLGASQVCRYLHSTRQAVLGLLCLKTVWLTPALCPLRAPYDPVQVESQANITEVHEPLAFDGRYAEGADARRANRRGAGEQLTC